MDLELKELAHLWAWYPWGLWTPSSLDTKGWLQQSWLHPTFAHCYKQLPRIKMASFLILSNLFSFILIWSWWTSDSYLTPLPLFGCLEVVSVLVNVISPFGGLQFSEGHIFSNYLRPFKQSTELETSRNLRILLSLQIWKANYNFVHFNVMYTF